MYWWAPTPSVVALTEPESIWNAPAEIVLLTAVAPASTYCVAPLATVVLSAVAPV